MTAIVVEAGRVAGIEAEELATRYGTPLYVYDLDAVDARFEGLRDALPPSFELAYAAKANPAPAMLDEMCRLGLGLDIASGGELAASQRVGFDPGRVVFTGPGKTDAELTAAVGAKLRAITVESAGELGRLERIAAAAGRRVAILLRVAVRGDGEETPILAGGWRKFGIDARQLEAVALPGGRRRRVPVVRRAARGDQLSIVWLHRRLRAGGRRSWPAGEKRCGPHRAALCRADGDRQPPDLRDRRAVLGDRHRHRPR